MRSFVQSTILLLAIFVFTACDDMKDVPSPIQLPNAPGETGQMYVLSEGLFNLNNSTLSLIDFNNKIINNNYFLFQNDRGLGDTANDMQRYGSKLWIVVNVSSQVEVLDLKTGVSIRRIPFFNTNKIARQPRYIAFSGNKAYVCSFDGTVARIDTSTLAVEATITVGRNPDGITTANGKLYVANSGGLDAPNFDNTVSVIDLNSFSETTKIVVGLNPYKLQTDTEGDVYAISRGDNGNIKAKFVRINGQTNEVAQTFDNLPAINFTIHNDTAYLYNYDYIKNTYWIKTFDCKTEKVIVDNFISDNTTIQSPFGIFVHPTNGNVYLTDARSYTVKGDLLCFNRNGKLNYKIENIGLNPNSIVFR
jgi:YVTN family beta-propeller protein